MSDVKNYIRGELLVKLRPIQTQKGFFWVQDCHFQVPYKYAQSKEKVLAYILKMTILDLKTIFLGPDMTWGEADTGACGDATAEQIEFHFVQKTNPLFYFMLMALTR